MTFWLVVGSGARFFFNTSSVTFGTRSSAFYEFKLAAKYDMIIFGLIQCYNILPELLRESNESIDGARASSRADIQPNIE